MSDGGAVGADGSPVPAPSPVVGVTEPVAVLLVGIA